MPHVFMQLFVDKQTKVFWNDDLLSWVAFSVQDAIFTCKELWPFSQQHLSSYCLPFPFLIGGAFSRRHELQNSTYSRVSVLMIPNGNHFYRTATSANSCFSSSANTGWAFSALTITSSPFWWANNPSRIADISGRLMECLHSCMNESMSVACSG